MLTLAGIAVSFRASGGLASSPAGGSVERDRYAVRFADIECDAAAGDSAHGVPLQVSYDSKFPETFQSIDPDLATEALGGVRGAPWVAPWRMYRLSRRRRCA